MSTAEAQIGVNTNLQKQDLSNLDVTNLTALSPEVISRQATINIGTIGHVAHGKSTVVKAISGVQTVRFKNELERNITIKLERISKERLDALLKSPELLHEYEQRMEYKLKMRNGNSKRTSLRTLRRCIYMSAASSMAETKLQKRPQGSSPTHDSLLHTVNSLGSLMQQQRQLASSPSSSGYETLTDNGSVYSLDSVDATTTTTKTRKRAKSMGTETANAHQQDESNRRASLTAIKTKNNDDQQQRTTTGGAKRYKALNGEYVVERIECVESVNGDAVFFVKWLGYPESQNTWESLKNVQDCAVFEEFIEDQSVFFESTIAAISDEIETEIERDGLSFDGNNLTMAQLDAFEPLLMKVDFLLLAQFRDAKSRSQKEPEKIRKRLVNMLLLKPYYYMRKSQKEDLLRWQAHANAVELQAPIAIENNVDLEVPDPKFEYILESFFGETLQTPQKHNEDDSADDKQQAAPTQRSTETPPNPAIGCECESCVAYEGKCCARMAGSRFAYEKNGRLRLNPGEAIYECNRHCACDNTCRNRVIQHGRKNALTIFKTSTGCGWGVRTERPLRKGEYVCEYVGEIISTDEANERGKRYDDIGRTYLFDLDYNTTAESVYTIDAAMFGNVSHFINHSCDPNLAVFPFWIDNLDVNMPRLAFFTLRAVRAGEELNFDYIRPNGDGEGDSMVYQNLSTAKKVSCRCGADNCRGVLF